VIAVICALDFEAKYLKKTFNHSNVEYYVIQRTGDKIQSHIEKIISKNNVHCIILMGFAGGLTSVFNVGDVVIARNFTSSQFCKLFDEQGGDYAFAQLATVERVAGSRLEKALLHRQTEAQCCDMETAHVWKLAERFSLPMITVRAISDAWDRDLPIPDHILIHPDTSKPAIFRIFFHLLSYPKIIPDFIRMVASAARAAKRLAKVVESDVIPRVHLAVSQDALASKREDLYG